MVIATAAHTKQATELNRHLQVAWLTPSEIFSPFYGRAVAMYMLQQHRAAASAQPLQVYELGAGTGTLARDILDHVKTVGQSAVQEERYELVSSPQEVKCEGLDNMSNSS